MAAKPRIKKVREKQPASSIKTPKTEARVNKATQQSSEAKTKWNKLEAAKRQVPKAKKRQALIKANQVNIGISKTMFYLKLNWRIRIVN